MALSETLSCTPMTPYSTSLMLLMKKTSFTILQERPLERPKSRPSLEGHP
jgi:hypothetical protein